MRRGHRVERIGLQVKFQLRKISEKKNENFIGIVLVFFVIKKKAINIIRGKATSIDHSARPSVQFGGGGGAL